jgi:hypothetical protein
MKRAAIALLLGLLLAGAASAQSAKELEDYIRDGSVVELRPDNAADVLNAALADKKRDTFEWFVVSLNEKSLVVGIDCSDLHACGKADKSGWTYHGIFWIKATCENGCDSHRFPPEQVWCYATLERQRRGFELYISVPERVGGKPKLSWWKVSSVFTMIPEAPKEGRK